MPATPPWRFAAGFIWSLADGLHEVTAMADAIVQSPADEPTPPVKPPHSDPPPNRPPVVVPPAPHEPPDDEPTPGRPGDPSNPVRIIPPGTPFI